MDYKFYLRTPTNQILGATSSDKTKGVIYFRNLTTYSNTTEELPTRTLTYGLRRRTWDISKTREMLVNK